MNISINLNEFILIFPLFDNVISVFLYLLRRYFIVTVPVLDGGNLIVQSEVMSAVSVVVL